MICPSCGTKNNYYHRYCYYCGNKLLSQAETVDPQDKDKSGMLFDDLDKTLYSSFEDTELDYTEQVPLRRYRKSKPQNSSRRLINICIGIVLLALLGVSGYVLGDQLIKQNKKTDVPDLKITASTFVEAAIVDGKPVHRIIVNTSNGEEVEILGETYQVVNGKAEIVYDDAFLYSTFSEGNNNEQVEVALDITIYKEGFPEANERVEFILDTPLAPLTMIYPESDEILIEEDTCRIVFKVEPGSQVFINNDNFSDLVDSEGMFEKEFQVPEKPENIFKIRVSKKNYTERVHKLVLKRRGMEFPLTIDQSSPIEATGEWVKITGNTDPQAVLEVDLETRAEPEVDAETGNFTIYVKATHPGYTPCTITAHLEGKEDSVRQVVIERPTTAAYYTRRAWAVNYNQLKSNPDLHNGQIYVFEGTVTDIKSMGDKNMFTLDISKDSQSQQLVFVEYWGSISMQTGDKFRIFGNRWGNYEEMPRFLAKFIYPR
ncbi:MAG: hypothetical protein GX094_00295 [Clostridiales bacterium]|jgi:hypothetical protein|nr:hypothetical protein [Clostridiales bacterium]